MTTFVNTETGEHVQYQQPGSLFKIYWPAIAMLGPLALGYFFPIVLFFAVPVAIWIGTMYIARYCFIAIADTVRYGSAEEREHCFAVADRWKRSFDISDGAQK